MDAKPTSPTNTNNTPTISKQINAIRFRESVNKKKFVSTQAFSSTTTRGSNFMIFKDIVKKRRKKIKSIMHATLPKLISKICSPETPKTLVVDLILTHSSYMSSRDFMTNLISRFMSYNFEKNSLCDSSGYDVPIRICYILKKWLQICPETFQKDCKLTQILVFLVEKHLDQVFLNKSSRKIKLLLESNIISNRRKSVHVEIDSQKFITPLLPPMFSGFNFILFLLFIFQIFLIFDFYLFLI